VRAEERIEKGTIERECSVVYQSVVSSIVINNVVDIVLVVVRIIITIASSLIHISHHHCHAPSLLSPTIVAVWNKARKSRIPNRLHRQNPKKTVVIEKANSILIVAFVLLHSGTETQSHRCYHHDDDVVTKK